MLFNYRYVHHDVETFQLYLDHLVKEVWCKAAGDFSLDLLHPDLKDIVLEIFNTEENKPRGKVNDWLDRPIKKIFELFKTLTPEQRQQVAVWYDNNNDIEALCAGDPLKVPATYADIRAINADLEAALKDFCRSLFTDVIHLKAVTSRIKEIEDHYKAFSEENRGGKCPYCGYGDIKGIHHTHRDAYDHFLPKGTYPFNSVNFQNLAPMCHDCNSTYKLAKDPTRHVDPIGSKDGITRRKAFYSYSTAEPGITLAVTINVRDISKLEPDEIVLHVTAQGREEEVEAWKEVFGIEERYKAKICAGNDGKAWLEQVIEEAENVSMTPADLLSAERRVASRRPFADANFLRIPFLDGCQAAGII